ncbi:hypothetical protein MPH_07440 [Macrophomina phaseolina MS6]|uniref:Prolyl 4-hydroxylase alpha subunit Fe(2+) 2OG dioxygenase domain-containing protein n=1 Tax=Macrophomina phaseolina (strain MS6) TaxID=1126212 RepID=K2RYW0_MACPH|nr:hypothetical protein MPH_07440 [Macrophomina phaseolina MS6]
MISTTTQTISRLPFSPPQQPQQCSEVGVHPHGKLPTHPAASWETNQPVPLTRQSLLDLLAGKTPLIKVPGFATRDECTQLVTALLPKLRPYEHATGPAVNKVGLAQFEFQAQSEEDYEKRDGSEKQRYFDAAAELRSLHADLAASSGGTNLWARIIAAISGLVQPDWDAGLAAEPSSHPQSQQQQYFSGIFREINNGTPIHCDWCPYDCNTEDWILSRITSQAVFNLYLTPVRGGATTLYDVQWTPDALRFRDRASYGYDRKLVEGKRSCRFEPEVGDLYIFNSRNMHEVKELEPCAGSAGLGHLGRIALASFMGVLPGEETGGKPRLMFWS